MPPRPSRGRRRRRAALRFASWWLSLSDRDSDRAVELGELAAAGRDRELPRTWQRQVGAADDVVAGAGREGPQAERPEAPARQARGHARLGDLGRLAVREQQVEVELVGARLRRVDDEVQVERAELRVDRGRT